MYEEDGSSEGGPKGSFENFKAEGDVLFKKEEHQKALSSYSTALDIRPGDRNCLVARAQCYLALGNADAALEDAEATLAEDKNCIQGLKMKAEALYTKGNFEFALVFYQRGYKLRPEVKEFRLGIQKSEEAIENSIGDTANLQLKNSGDLSYFYQEEQNNKQKKKQGGGGYSRAVAKKEPAKSERKPRAANQDPKTIKQLLGELYADKEYLEKLWSETDPKQNETNDEVHSLAENALDYLESRAEFWQQQKPMYARKNAKKQGRKSEKEEPSKHILKTLEEIDDLQAEGKYQESLKLSKKLLKQVENMSDEDVVNREEVVANLHSCIGNAYLELEEYDKSYEHHTKDQEIAEQHNIEDAKSRALDNLGRCYARMGKYEEAIKAWEDKLPMSKSALESTWLYHEIGRCHLERERFGEAKEFGEKSLGAAKEAEDAVWQLNASVLIAQSEVKLEDYLGALDSFESALEMAKNQKDSAAETAIKKAIDDVNKKIAIKEKGEDATDEEAASDDVQKEKEDSDQEKEREKEPPREEGEEQEQSYAAEDDKQPGEEPKNDDDQDT